MSDRVRRWPVVAVVAALLAAGAVADRVARPEPSNGVARLRTDQPSAAPADALSSSWFCAGATATAKGAADGSIWIANPGADEATGTVTFVPVVGSGDPKTVPIRVPGHSRRHLRHADAIDAPYAAAMVELDGGGVVVEHSVGGPLGEDVAPCASNASERWYVAEGSTARDATMLLALFNPFPEDAIADLAFATEEGKALPADFQGVVVPARGLVVVDVGQHVRRREHVAATVTTRAGRLVVDRIQFRNAAPVKGITLTLAAPSPGRTWWFPEGVKAPGVLESLHLYNPTETEAVVDVELTLDEGGVEPYEVRVPPRDRFTLEIDKEERVPPGVPHAFTVRSMNDVPVVVERWVAAAGSGRSGLAAMLGAREPAQRWVFAAGASVERVDEWIVLQNPGPGDARVDLFALANGRLLPIDGLQDLQLAAGRRQGVRLGDSIKREDLAVLVVSDRPIVAERDLYRVGSAGMSSAIGIPLR